MLVKSAGASSFVPSLQPEFVDSLRRLAAEHMVCDRCLGRFVGKSGHGFTNGERGAALRLLVGSRPVAEADCGLCEGAFADCGHLARLVEAAWRGLEFSTFVVGCRLDAWIVEREKSWLAGLGESFQDLAEPMKTEMNREIGRRVEASSGKKVDFHRPEITVLVDTRFDQVDLQVASLYLQGRYRKLVRGIPQTRWPCRNCRGVGCPRCDQTGKMYAESVEELVAAVPMKLLEAKEHAFHGMGREDIDALMLGGGRPFVVELKEPRRRTLDIPAVQAEINRTAAAKVEVLDLRPATRDDVVAVKSAASPKSYVAVCEASQELPVEKLLSTLSSLRGVLISQRTPSRVSHRRADLVRARRVLDVELVGHEGRQFTLRITAEAGTYIKELVSSDDGRTEPSLAGLLGVPVTVTALDVVAIAGASPRDGEYVGLSGIDDGAKGEAPEPGQDEVE